MAVADVDAVTEAELQTGVIQMAQLLGYRVAHFRPAQMQSGRWATPMSGDPGWPDLAICGNGRFLAVELKSARGDPSAAQLDWLSRLTDAGVDARTWRPSHWVSGEVERVLRGGGN